MLGCTTISLLSSYTGKGFWTPPPRMATQPATAATTARVAANDNKPALSGKKAHAWPALSRAKAGKLLDGEKDNRLAAAVLEGFAALYCETALDPSAIPSPAGALLDLSIGIADLPEGAMGEDGSYGVDRRIERSAEAEADLILQMHSEGRLRISRDGYDYLDGRDRWRVLPLDNFKQPRGAAQRKASKPLTVQSSKSKQPGAHRPATPQLDRLIAMEEIGNVRSRLSADSWAGLVAIAVEKATARQLGERAGLTFKRAEAKGGELMAKYTQAAIAAFQLPDAANDNRPEAKQAA